MIAEALRVLLYGMLGVFLVLGLIFGVIVALSRFSMLAAKRAGTATPLLTGATENLPVEPVESSDLDSPPGEFLTDNALDQDSIPEQVFADEYYDDYQGYEYVLADSYDDYQGTDSFEAYEVTNLDSVMTR